MSSSSSSLSLCPSCPAHATGGHRCAVVNAIEGAARRARGQRPRRTVGSRPARRRGPRAYPLGVAVGQLAIRNRDSLDEITATGDQLAWDRAAAAIRSTQGYTGAIDDQVIVAGIGGVESVELAYVGGAGSVVTRESLPRLGFGHTELVHRLTGPPVWIAVCHRRPRHAQGPSGRGS
jgi:hypothetical protein